MLDAKFTCDPTLIPGQGGAVGWSVAFCVQVAIGIPQDPNVKGFLGEIRQTCGHLPSLARMNVSDVQ